MENNVDEGMEQVSSMFPKKTMKGVVSKKAAPLSRLNIKSASNGKGGPTSAQAYNSPRASPYAHPMTAHFFPDTTAESLFSFPSAHSGMMVKKALSSPQLSTAVSSQGLVSNSPQKSPLSTNTSPSQRMSPLQRFESSPQFLQAVAEETAAGFPYPSPLDQQMASTSATSFSVPGRTFPPRFSRIQTNMLPQGTSAQFPYALEMGTQDVPMYNNNAVLNSAGSDYLPNMDPLAIKSASTIFDGSQSAMPFAMSSDMFSFADVPTIDARFIDVSQTLPSQIQSKFASSHPDLNEITNDPAKFIDWLSK
ncbi:hypothetical protein HDV03_000976 [Kappamyces sp. JEL0829]|nr:hypothetical protein HDV03_000976 [Kappamyces sp. JEL0829]